jgi:hypothetical protein
MTPKPKTAAAQNALRRWLPKMAAAREALRRHSLPEELRCTAKVDRLIVACADLYMGALLELEGFSREKSHWLKPKTATDFIAYGRVTKLINKRSGAQILVYSERKSRKLAPYRITFIPADKVGLRPEDALAVVRCVDGHRIALAEVALDFPFGCGLNCAFVRQHGLFGKSRPYSVGKKPGWDAWGSRRGAKFVRSYYKKEIGAHRLELQAQARLLRENRIDEVRDLPRLAKILPGHHIWFARLSEEKLTAALGKSGLGPEKVREITDGVAARKKNLWAALRYLRRWGLKNSRRLVVPIQVNHDVREALNRWATRWRTAIQGSDWRQ